MQFGKLAKISSLSVPLGQQGANDSTNGNGIPHHSLVQQLLLKARPYYLFASPPASPSLQVCFLLIMFSWPAFKS